MKEQVKERITELLNTRFEGTPFYLVNIKRSSPTRITVFIDHDEVLKIEDCAKVSRFIEDYLDSELPLGEKYTLDVSSPGMFSQFLSVRQYKKRVGSKFELTIKGRNTFKATLQNVDGELLFFELEKSKKNPDPEVIKLTIEEIKKSKLKFNINKKQKMQ